MVDGVIVCTDGGTSDQGDICVVDVATQTQTCLGNDGNQTSGATGNLGPGLGHVKGAPAQSSGTGWLSRITGWLAYALNVLFSAIVQVLKDLVTFVLAVVLGVVLLAIQAIPVPDWISGHSLGTSLGQLGPIVGFFMSTLQVPAALALIGSGYAFRLLQKFVTLFQW